MWTMKFTQPFGGLSELCSVQSSNTFLRLTLRFNNWQLVQSLANYCCHATPFVMTALVWISLFLHLLTATHVSCALATNLFAHTYTHLTLARLGYNHFCCPFDRVAYKTASYPTWSGRQNVVALPNATLRFAATQSTICWRAPLPSSPLSTPALPHFFLIVCSFYGRKSKTLLALFFYCLNVCITLLMARGLLLGKW